MDKETFYRDYGVYPLRQWTYPKILNYNGFTSDERIVGWQLASWFMDNGWLAKPEVCSVTGSTTDVAYHSENYYLPWDPYYIGKKPHTALHCRFKSPAWWRSIVEKNKKTGEEWFCHLSFDSSYDLATQYRSEFGQDARDVFAHAPVPDNVDVPWDVIRPTIHPIEDA